MKIKFNFVTNSSSTCFVVILSKGQEFTLDRFMKGVGINNKSPIYSMFERVFEMFRSNMEPFDNAVNSHRWNKSKKWDEFIREIFSDALVKRINIAKKNGESLYFGTLSSEDDTLESFFCCDSFKIEGDGFFIDATNSTW